MADELFKQYKRSFEDRLTEAKRFFIVQIAVGSNPLYIF